MSQKPAGWGGWEGRAALFWSQCTADARAIWEEIKTPEGRVVLAVVVVAVGFLVLLQTMGVQMDHLMMISRRGGECSSALADNSKALITVLSMVVFLLVALLAVGEALHYLEERRRARRASGWRVVGMAGGLVAAGGGTLFVIKYFCGM